MKQYLLLLFTLLLAFPLQAQVYTWTDSSGNVHFSDKPRPGAKEVDLPPPQTYSSPPSPPPSQMSESQAAEEPTDYKLEIVEPKNQATIRNNQGYIPVIVEVSPELEGGNKLQIVFDGRALGEPKATTSFALKDVNRGTHTIGVQLVNSEGKILKTSSGITVFMHRPRVGMVPGTAGPR